MMPAKPRQIVLVTEDRYLHLDAGNWYHEQIAREEGLLAAALEAHGFAVQRQSWSDRSVDWAQFEAAVFRSTWDYFERLAQFLPWLEQAEARTRLFNEPALVRWNADKRYLADLAAAGVAVVPSRFVDRGSAASLGRLAGEQGWSEVVFKPVVSGAGRHTYRVGAAEFDAHEAIFRDCLALEDMMVQPFEPAILADGELSVIVIDGRATHGIRKTAKAGEFRVQDDHGGTAHPHQPSVAERRFAEAAVAACPAMPLYARVDFVATGADSFRLMELELIEPELFFRFQPDAANALAMALCSRLG